MTKDELRGKGQRSAPTARRLSDDGQDREGHLCGQRRKTENRVKYFQDSAAHSVKTRQMVSQVDHFDTIFVTSEFEALVLENSLIKRHMPRYNILLKDDKGLSAGALQPGAVSEIHPGESDPPMTARVSTGPLAGGTRPVRSGCGMSGFAPAHLPPTVSAGHRRGQPSLSLHMGRCDGFSPPGDAGGGI